MSGSAHEFDWQATRDGHEAWALTTLLKDADIDQLSDDTNGFTEVKIEIFVNGNRVHAKEYMERLWQNVEHLANLQARELVENIEPLVKLNDDLCDFQRKISEQMEDFAVKHGIEFP